MMGVVGAGLPAVARGRRDRQAEGTASAKALRRGCCAGASWAPAQGVVRSQVVMGAGRVTRAVPRTGQAGAWMLG